MTPLRRLAVAALALPPLLLAGCGDDEPDVDPGPSDESDATGAVAVEGCDYLPVDAVTEAIGQEMRLDTEGPVTCLFGSVDEALDLSVVLNLTELAIDTEEYAAGSRDNCDSEPTDIDAGEIAFTCVTFVGAQGYVFDRGHSVVLDVIAGDETASLEAAAAMLPSVTMP